MFLALVAAALISLAHAQSTCSYAALPANVTLILVSDNTLCPEKNKVCVVNKACEVIANGTNGTVHAVGNFLDFNETTLEIRKPNASSIKVHNASNVFSTLNTDMMVFPDSIKRIVFQGYELPSVDTIKWPKKLTELLFQKCNRKAVPVLPPNLTKLFLAGNDLNESTQVANLPSTIEWLSLQDNMFTEFVNFSFKNATTLYLLGNTQLRRIENVTVSKDILHMDLSNTRLDSWIMDNTTFRILDSQLKPNSTAVNLDAVQKEAPIGYGYTNLVINFNATECSLKNGVKQEIWSDKRNRMAAYRDTVFNVCVLKDPEPKPTVPAVVASSSLSTGAIVGISLGGLALLVMFIRSVMWRVRHNKAEKKLQDLQNQYDLTHTPNLSNGEEAGLSMQDLTLFRLDDSNLKLDKKLGSGAFADVWLGTFQDQVVAVKKMHNSKITLDQIQSFIDEIKLMATFDSPFIVRLIGAAWTRPSDVKCVMELMDGGDLKDFLDKMTPKTFPWSDKLVHIQSIVGGLVYLHSMNIIHRDLKSRNVLLSSTAGTKLTDFGISKEDMHATMTMGVGTFRWMAPEVVQDQAYTVAADIYSFGMVLSEFDTHHIPYEDFKNPANGNPIADSAIMVKVVGGTIKPTFTKSCPHWVHDIAMRCLAYNPEHRPTAFDLSRELRTLAKEL
ncbi:Aste57867_12293 [Aphanomyces stellatus]|uniref:Aste57867_12293 protein n=1 Tax=Aphanomyces stellatus TaxID=120398 RepID=A0A485KWK0_9STRA|nr:hypothetical protein As57867_012248 [Aphanomyces stellatus]VFT89146.1 Aste57867_12293 [Aphanomyces stellatus]